VKHFHSSIFKQIVIKDYSTSMKSVNRWHFFPLCLK